jgi:hypothetical protein
LVCIPGIPRALGARGYRAPVQLTWQDPIERAAAQALVGRSDEVALLWVGFEVPGRTEAFPDGQLGYSACGAVPRFLRDGTSRLGRFGGSGGFRDWEVAGSGVEHALEQLRRATAELAGSGWVDEDTGFGPLQDVEGTADALASGDPAVTSLVVTGPLGEVAAVVDAADATQADLLEIDFDRGTPDPCG